MDSLMERAAPCPAAQAGSVLLPALHLPLLPPHLYRPATSHEHKLNFRKSKEACLTYIQDAMLQKQWKRAAEFLTFYIESLEKDFSTEYMGPSEMIWRIGTEILCHHSYSSMKDFNSFIEQMKTLGVKRYLKVCLEHAFHLLCNGQTDEAYQNLSLAESWRFGEQTTAQDKELKLIQAYRGLLDYYSWSKQKNVLLEYGTKGTSKVQSTNDKEGFEDLSVEQEMHSSFRKAAVNLKEIIQIPGVWDVFVKCYVDLLEFYGDHDEARQVLSEYAYNSKFPANPNAHVYFYQFLKRHGEPKKSLISVLKILHDIVPSHELMIDFNTMLQKSTLRSILTGSSRSGTPERTGGRPSILAATWQKGIGRKMKALRMKKLWWLESYWERIASTLNMYHTKAVKIRRKGFGH
ncbi:TATA box-binding protein-associated factor RNA polymerase I subunit A isoform X4 [Apteryx mantelli]|uniref:TATA box-binding protein-associated factor RNA polymerase I subunit A isoform X4 n=1 Tax=Apteryx mantelli TaxID=2696672 RepID=A0ABM4E8F1_9AVES